MSVQLPTNQTANLPATVDQNTCCGWISDLMNRLVAILSNFFASVAAFFTGSNQSQVTITPPPPNVPVTPHVPGGSVATAARPRQRSLSTPSGPPCVTVEDHAALDTRATAIRTTLHQNVTTDRDYWNQHMVIRRVGAYVNLSQNHSNTLIDHTAHAQPLLPMFGHYDTRGYEFAGNQLIVRLPRAQLATFPQEIQEKFRALDDHQLDLFLIVCNGSQLTTTSRNVVLHSLAYPNMRQGESRHFQAEIGLFDPVGVQANSHGSVGIGTFTRGTHDIHPHPVNTSFGQTIAFSPDNMRFTTPPNTPFSSFAVGSTLPEGRGVAAQVVMINDRTSESAGALLSDVLNVRGQTLQETRAAFEVEFQRSAPGVYGQINRALTFHETPA